MAELIDKIIGALLAASVLTTGFMLFLYDHIQTDIDIAKMLHLIYQRAQEVR